MGEGSSLSYLDNLSHVHIISWEMLVCQTSNIRLFLMFYFWLSSVVLRKFV